MMTERKADVFFANMKDIGQRRIPNPPVTAADVAELKRLQARIEAQSYEPPPVVVWEKPQSLAESLQGIGGRK